MSEYPSDWEILPLGEVVEKITSGGTPKADNPDLYGGDIPFLKIDDITSSSKYLKSHKVTINERGLSESSAKIVPAGTLLLTMYGTIGRCCITTYPVATNQAIASFLGHPKVELEYLYYALESKADEFAVASSQTTQANISAGILKQTPIAIPLLPEQKKIAEILSGIDDVIHKHRILLARQSMAFTAILNEAIAQVNDDHLRTVGDLIEIGIITAMKDGNHGEQYPRQDEFASTGVPFLAATSIDSEGDVDYLRCPRLSETRASTMRIQPAYDGDVILTHNASIGKVTVIPQGTGKVVASTSTTYYRVDSHRLYNRYLAAVFRSEFFQSQLKRVMGQTTRNQVPISAQKKLLIPLPPLDQQRWISLLYEYQKLIMRKKKMKLVALENLRFSLVSELLSGRKRVIV